MGLTADELMPPRPWKCGWCYGEAGAKPCDATVCAEPGCGIQLCEACTIPCSTCGEARCLEHAVTYEARSHCAGCRAVIQRDTAHERLVAAVHGALPEERSLVAFAGFLRAALGGA
jgi:hypothetical protein